MSGGRRPTDAGSGRTADSPARAPPLPIRRSAPSLARPLRSASAHGLARLARARTGAHSLRRDV